MKWIDVKIELPEKNVSVLLFTDSGVIEGHIDDKNIWSFICLDYHGCGCCGGNADIITHWMPLTNLPPHPTQALQ